MSKFHNLKKYKYIFFLVFDFCRFCVVIRFFFVPATTANDLRILRISVQDLMHYIFVQS